MNVINNDLKDYIERLVLPKYTYNDEGHQLDHIDYVIDRSFRFANQVDNANLDMVYTIAAYHDIAHHINKDQHEKISAKLFYDDKFMKLFFTEEERLTIKEAIEDHRASLKSEPRSIYGKIVSSADKSVNIDTTLQRAHAYSLKHYPNLSLDEMIKRAYKHIKNKYGENGYSKIYFKDDEYEKAKKEIIELLSDKERFVKRYLAVNNLINITYEEDQNLKNSIFEDDRVYYKKLEILHLEKLYLKELKRLFKNSPYVVEFCGTPRTGKTTMINNIGDFFTRGGFNVAIIEELTTSDYFKEEIKPAMKDKSIEERCLLIIEEAEKQLITTLEHKHDVVLIDRSINDRCIWNYVRFLEKAMKKDTCLSINEKYKKISKRLINMLVISYASSITSIKRDYQSSLSLDSKSHLNMDNLNAYNDSLLFLKDDLKNNVSETIFLNTEDSSTRDNSILVANSIVSSMRKQYLKKC